MTESTESRSTEHSGRTIDRPEGEIEPTVTQRVGARVNVLAGLAVGASFVASISSLPTVSSV